MRIPTRSASRSVQGIMTMLKCQNNPVTNKRYTIRPIFYAYGIILMGLGFLYVMIPFLAGAIAVLILLYFLTSYLIKATRNIMYSAKGHKLRKQEGQVKTYRITDRVLAEPPPD
jgi:membrane protein CcdC involved in cytochrome C biogenesis